MKTIEERAREYATIISENPDPLRPGDAPRVTMRVDKHLKEAFTAGANSERVELTQWNNPDEPPTSEKEVILKLDYEDDGQYGYTIAQWMGEVIKWRMDDSMYGYKIIGWRDIH